MRIKQKLSMKTVLAGAVVLLAAPTAVAITGGTNFFTGLNRGYIGPMPAALFANEPCNTEPITFFDGLLTNEWQVDVSAVANDGDPNTFARCTLLANNQTNTCIVGLSDGTIIACRDESGPHALPTDGDILYLNFLKSDVTTCNVVVGTHDRFGEADPKCRESNNGTGGSGSGSGLGCDSGNSTPVVKAAVTALQEGVCYSFNKTSGTLKVGNWSGTTFDVDVEDSAANLVSASIGSGNWFNVGGVADGTIYFKVDVNGGSSVNAQVDSW